VRGADVLLRFRYAAHITPGLPKGMLAPATRAQLLALEDGIDDWIRANSRIESAAGVCTFALDNLVGPDKEDNLEVTAVWTCPGTAISGLRIRFQPLSTTMNDWQTIASMKLGGRDSSTVLTPDAANWIVGEPFTTTGATTTPSSSSFARFFSLGVHHIWTGYDHLLFLVAVLLAGGGLGRLAAIVTSFTVAHSFTLGAAATGLVRLPVAPVEAAIALSIVVVAAENILRLGADRRALVTFAFGLVHGFGFASVLSETALPPSGVVLPLLAFNLGVEAGQLAVVAVVVPLLAVVLASAHGRRVQVALSALVALAGAAWAVERIAAMLA
jgi:hydrogenase/urease accessory protein HupE